MPTPAAAEIVPLLVTPPPKLPTLDAYMPVLPDEIVPELLTLPAKVETADTYMPEWAAEIAPLFVTLPAKVEIDRTIAPLPPALMVPLLLRLPVNSETAFIFTPVLVEADMRPLLVIPPELVVPNAASPVITMPCVPVSVPALLIKPAKVAPLTKMSVA